jgi:hypothetical protein
MTTRPVGPNERTFILNEEDNVLNDLLLLVETDNSRNRRKAAFSFQHLFCHAIHFQKPLIIDGVIDFLAGSFSALKGGLQS